MNDESLQIGTISCAYLDIIYSTYRRDKIKVRVILNCFIAPSCLSWFPKFYLWMRPQQRGTLIISHFLGARLSHLIVKPLVQGVPVWILHSTNDAAPGHWEMVLLSVFNRLSFGRIRSSARGLNPPRYTQGVPGDHAAASRTRCFQEQATSTRKVFSRCTVRKQFFPLNYSRFRYEQGI